MDSARCAYFSSVVVGSTTVMDAVVCIVVLSTTRALVLLSGAFVIMAAVVLIVAGLHVVLVISIHIAAAQVAILAMGSLCVVVFAIGSVGVRWVVPVTVAIGGVAVLDGVRF